MTVRSRRFRPFEGTPTSDLARLLVLPRYAWKEAFSAKLVVGAFSLSFVVPLGALVLVWLKHNVAALVQGGYDNFIAVQQMGLGNLASIVQGGAGNRAQVAQNGNYNRVEVLQLGQGMWTSIVQNGNHNTTRVIQQ